MWAGRGRRVPLGRGGGSGVKIIILEHPCDKTVIRGDLKCLYMEGRCVEVCMECQAWRRQVWGRGTGVGVLKWVRAGV